MRSRSVAAGLERELAAEQGHVARSERLGRIVRAYYFARLQNNRLLRLLQASFEGFWLGTLSDAELDAIDDTYYVGEYGRRQSPVDYSSDEWNERGLFEWEATMIDRHFTAGSRIGLMGAGGGRELLALLRRSFRVCAWECQPSLVSAANQRAATHGFPSTVVHAPRNEIPRGDEQFDGVILGWGTYSLVRRRAERVALLREIRTRVDDGSPILISFVSRSPGDDLFRIVAAVGNSVRHLRKNRRVELGDRLLPNYLHFFVREEVEKELLDGGFRMSYFSASPYGHAVGVADG